ncbi:hypothetical protein [Dongia sp.]|uniref:hypothetical protein n=1 Tax=Dongia sp. TaxID=1977262 RepID=UPI0035AEED45
MLSGGEIRAAFTGLALLLRFDAHFVNWFDRSAAGARRSFRLMLPLLPITLVRIFMWYDADPSTSAFEVGISIATFYVLSRISFPLLLIVIGRALEREGQAIAALSSYNWFGFSLSVLGFVVGLFGLFGPLAGPADIAITVIIIVSLVYEAFLLNTALGIGYFGAGLLAVVDYIIGQSLFIALLIYPAIIVPQAI